MQYGTVKMWNSAKGFGFIVSDDDEELFVHAGDLHITVKDKRLHEGQRVGFDMRQEMKGDKAINVWWDEKFWQKPGRVLPAALIPG